MSLFYNKISAIKRNICTCENLYYLLCTIIKLKTLLLVISVISLVFPPLVSLRHRIWLMTKLFLPIRITGLCKKAYVSSQLKLFENVELLTLKSSDDGFDPTRNT